MITERLFDKDGFLLSFTACVLACKEEEHGFAVALDRTAFAPQGGGQGSDCGSLDGQTVTEVTEEDRCIWHHVPLPISVGTEVQGQIDRELRYYHLQNHSGEHILSGLIHSRYGYDNVGFHLGSQVTLDVNGVLTEAQIEDLEQEANLMILQNRPISAYYPDRVALASMEYRSKLELTEQVRIVEIEGVDRCACCAPHVDFTGQIGGLRILSAVHYKGGMRLTILCGLSAMAAWRTQSVQVSGVSAALSVPSEQILAGVTRLQGELIAQKQAATRVRMARIEALLSLLHPKGEKAVLFTSEWDGKGLRDLAGAFASEKGCAALVLCPKDPEDRTGGFLFALALPQTVTEGKAFYQALCAAIDCKGGGKPPFFSGSVEQSKETLALLLTQRDWEVFG